MVSETLAQALVAFQAEAPHIELDSTNPHFKSKFASLAGVMKTVRPVLAKHGLAIVQQPTNMDFEKPALLTTLLHVSGASIVSDPFPLAVEKPGPQAQGAALTYARRYAVLAILGLVGDEDDDAESAEAKPVEKLKAKAEPTVNAATLKLCVDLAESLEMDWDEEAQNAYGKAGDALTVAEAKDLYGELAKAAK